jgi:excisionase family DNA binding protein
MLEPRGRAAAYPGMSAVVDNALGRGPVVPAAAEDLVLPEPPESVAVLTGWPELLTAAEVAAALRVSKATVYRLTASGALPAHVVGSSVRIERADLLTYIRSATVAAGDDRSTP